MRYKAPRTGLVSADFPEGGKFAAILLAAGYKPVAEPAGAELGKVAPAQPDDNPFALPAPLNQPTIAPADAAVVNAPDTDDTEASSVVKTRAGKGIAGLKRGK